MRQNSNAAVGKPGPLPANLDEMKVKVGAALSPVELYSCFFVFFLPLTVMRVSTESCFCPGAELRWTGGS